VTPEVEQLLSEFIREFEAAGEADPRSYLGRVEGVDRRELEALIEGYLDRAPVRRWDPDAFAGSRAEAIATDLTDMHVGSAAPAPALRGLRARAEVKRSELVKRLAEALGVAGQEEKVGYYYHRMESGLQPPRGISRRVIDALAKIISADPEEIGRALAGSRPPAAPGGTAPVMTRLASPPDSSEFVADEQMVEAFDTEEGEPGESAPAQASPAEEPDEVDRLFGGAED
jgi:hypothetical protein